MEEAGAKEEAAVAKEEQAEARGEGAGTREQTTEETWEILWSHYTCQ
jgi:hypothetical protein